MKKKFFYPKIFLLLCLTAFAGRQASAAFWPEKERMLIPQPASVVKGEGRFSFGKHTTIAVGNEDQAILATRFAALFTRPAGFTPQVKRTAEGDVCLIDDPSLRPEAYVLEIGTGRIELRASAARGFFYGFQTLRLLLPPALESDSPARETWSVPAMIVRDEPRFAYRGFMLDVARYFLPKAELLRMIDCIALLKINTLHLHLTDDNGWRLEIKKYPRLTEVGAWRVDRENQAYADRRNQRDGESTPIGGFYTQEEMREIIDYAAERQIEIIPEVDVPAHSNAALAAYPQYACPVVDQAITVVPGMGESHSDIIFCAGNEKTYAFLQDILDEVMALFPSRYMNLGGDEARKTYWEKCPLCRQRIREAGLPDEEALQGYFMGRLGAYVRSKGKQVIGWDELTNSKLPEESIILGWQGYGKAALKAAEQGHRFVMAPARVAYLIRYQGPQWFEPYTYFGTNTLKDLFDYEPVQPDWKPAYESLLWGVQACMWTEFCTKPEDVFYLTFPRLAALAEIGWVPKGRKEWETFLQGLDNYLAHIAYKGVRPARSMYNIQHTVTPSQGQLRVSMECIRPDVEIRYTLDNTPPSITSAVYEEPLRVEKDMVVKATTFAGGRPMGQTLVLPLKWNQATAKPLLPAGKAQSVLVNGVRGSLKQTDSEWYNAQPGTCSVTVDLLNVQPIRRCVVGCLTNYGMGVHKPRTVCLEVSIDNRNFTQAGKLVFSDEAIFTEGRFVENLSIEAGSVRARYIKLTWESAGKCPPDHVRPGQESRISLDEIYIE